MIVSAQMSDLQRSIADEGGLFTRAGLARRCGVSRQAVGDWTLRDDFPSPAAWVDGRTLVWAASEVDAWRTKQKG